jgi:site-specific recombinase XerD
MAYEAISKIKETAFTSPTYVCANRRGELVSPRIFETTLDRVYDLANIHLRVGTNSHALRHTFASMCFETGMPVKMVSELLGHSTVRLTMDTYVHLITEKNLEDVPELTSLR